MQKHYCVYRGVVSALKPEKYNCLDSLPISEFNDEKIDRIFELSVEIEKAYKNGSRIIIEKNAQMAGMKPTL